MFETMNPNSPYFSDYIDEFEAYYPDEPCDFYLEGINDFKNHLYAYILGKIAGTIIKWIGFWYVGKIILGL